MEWKEYKMKDLIEEISMGPFGSDVKKEFYVESGIPILNGSNLQGFKLQEESFGYLTKEKADSLKKSNASRGDIIVTHRGTLGQIVYVPEDSKYDRYVISQSQFRFRCNKDLVDTPYLVYYFHSRIGQHKILANASQVGVPALARASSTFREIEIKLPDLATQRRISSVLSSLDRKIELNNKINATLEEMAQALFKSWFVDFEPFKNGKFIETEIGEIPEGWRVGTLGEIVDFKNGFAFKSSSFSPNGQYKLVTIKAVQDGKLVTDGADKIESLPAKMPAHCLLKNGDILLSLTGNVGRVCIVTEDDLLLNQRVAAIEPKDSISKLYTYLLFRSKKTQNELIGISRGTAQANLSPIEAAKLQHVIPSVDALQRFNQSLGTAFEKFIKLSQETLTLTHLRDTLLPRLMSGEIEV